MAKRQITDFYPGTTKRFGVHIILNDAEVDLREDTLTFRIKRLRNDADDDAVVTTEADVDTSGAEGRALFSIEPDDTSSINPGTYHCDITWERDGGDEYVIYDSPITVKDRVSDA